MMASRCHSRLLVCRVHLPFGGSLIVEVNSGKQLVEELEAKVLRKLGIAENEEESTIFALAHVRAKEVYWLSRGQQLQQTGTPVLKNDTQTGETEFELHFLAKFVPRSVLSVRSVPAVLLLFHQARLQFVKGQLHLPVGQFARCCACLFALASTAGVADSGPIPSLGQFLRSHINPPQALLRQFGVELAALEDMVRAAGEECVRTSPSQLTVEFLRLCADAPLFGCCFYPVRERSGQNWTLALNGRQMAQLDGRDPYRPKRVWEWHSLSNFHCRDTEFVMEVPPPTEEQKILSAPQRLCFSLLSSRLCRSLWELAVALHRHNLDGREQRTSALETRNRAAEELVARLDLHFCAFDRDSVSSCSGTTTGSTATLPSIGSFSSLSLCSLSGYWMPSTARVADRSPMTPHSREGGKEKQQSGESEVPPKSEEECRRERELCQALLEQRERLEERLIARLEELKRVCLAEGELTGQLPKEVYKTLLPGEPVPQVKRRVGTAFKFPQELIHRHNTEGNTDELCHLEAEIELNRRIVAAAERLANDRSANKSVRKKRRKDLQAAAHRLRGLEKGLNRMRLSSSKPDVSSLTDSAGGAFSSASIGRQSGSGFSLNSLRAWPNFYNTLRISTKSCPTTPRGSVPDLTISAAMPSQGTGNRKTTPSTAKKLHNLLRGQQQQKAAKQSSCSIPSAEDASSSSSSSLSGHPLAPSTSTSSGISTANSGSLASSSNLLLLAPPPVPSRRPSGGERNNGGRGRECLEMDRSGAANDSDAHLYANIGYTSSAPYKSAYRQCQFPTMHFSPPSSSHSFHSTSFSAMKETESLAAEASAQLGQIVRRLDSQHRALNRHPLCAPLRPPQRGMHHSQQTHSTGSLDRRTAMARTVNGRIRSNCSAAALPERSFVRSGGTTGENHQGDLSHPQLVTTFPAADTHSFRPLEAADFARFRSISAVLDQQREMKQQHFPQQDERMEALLATIQRQSRGKTKQTTRERETSPNGGGTATVV